MQDNAPSQAAKKTVDHLMKAGFKNIAWWSSLHVGASIPKRKMYEGGRQFTTKNELWEALLESVGTILFDEIKTLTKSMDDRILKVISTAGGHISY